MQSSKRQKIFHIPCSPGIAIGNAFILDATSLEYKKYWIHDREVTREIARLKKAINKSKQQLDQIKEKLCRFQGQEQIQILESHRLLIQDEMLSTTTIRNIVDYRINAEWALLETISELKMSFADVHEEYFQERKNDIDYICQRILRNLIGDVESSLLKLAGDNTVLVAQNLSPAEVAALSKEKIKGFITEQGGPSSHTAIIARSLEIPAIVGVKNATQIISAGEKIVLDGFEGTIIINPTNQDIAQYKRKRDKYTKLEKILLKDIHLPTITKDKHHISLAANIELAEEADSAIQHGADGVGLYRTEYLFLNRLEPPSEEEQFRNYKMILKKFGNKPVTIRTADLGYDKLFGDAHDMVTNPALSLRGIRLSLKELSLFKTQLAALYRASAFGNLHILIPMIASFPELKAAKKIIREVKEELALKGIRFNTNVPLGIMVEVPSAAIMADIMAEEVDFLSIGTNDLIQYTLAIDRTDEHVSHLYNPLHPAILRLLKSVIDGAKHAGKPVSVCGEMASDPLYILILIGLGVDCLSMNPISIPLVKKILRSIAFKEAQELVGRIIGLTSIEQIEKIVRRETKKILPIYAKKPMSLLAKITK